MALGSFGLSRPRQARSEGLLPSYRHPEAPEPLMLLSAKRWKGKDSRIHRILGLSDVYQQHTIRHARLRPGISLKSQKQDVHLSDNAFLTPMFSSSELVENVSRHRCIEHICTCMCLCVSVCAYSCARILIHKRIRVLICKYTFTSLYTYAFMRL